MSRSRRHTPIWAHTCSGFSRGEQADKRRASRTLRRLVRERLAAPELQAFLGEPVEMFPHERVELDPYYYRVLARGALVDEPELILPTLREVSDPWGWAKDGKSRNFGMAYSEGYRRCMAK